MRKKTLILLFSSLLFLNACSSSTSEDNTKNPEETKEKIIQIAPGTVYTKYSLNIHDFVNPELSIESVNRFVDLHEKYQIPSRFCFSDQVYQEYIQTKEGIDLLDKIADASMITVCMHIRAPHPIVKGFDNIGLNKMNQSELEETLQNYADWALDPETGNYIEGQQGVYDGLTEVMGYAPPVISLSGETGKEAETLAQIYKEKGAEMIVDRQTTYKLGETGLAGLYISVENFDEKLYENINAWQHEGRSAKEIIENATKALEKNRGHFLGIKYHENNPMVSETPFWPIYWTDAKKSKALEAPYDLNAAERIKERSDFIQNLHWEMIEAVLAHVQDNRDELNPIGPYDLLELIKNS